MQDPKIGLLDQLPLFKGLSPKQLHAVVGISRKAFFEPGDYLIRANEAGETAFLIMTGFARCLAFPKGSSSSRIGPGTLVGELAILVDTIHSFTIQATERLRAMAIHRRALQRAMEKDPAIARVISDNLLLRLRAVAHDLRTVDVLLAKAERSSNHPQMKMPLEAVRPSPPAGRPLRRAASR
jgi:CRP/FNR family transcriptional regulator, cyclic AMP receptor protein